MHNSNAEKIGTLKTKDSRIDELTEIVKEYPYYSLAQFLLLSNYTINNHKDLERQASVTSLFFNNEKWLNLKLSHPDDTIDKLDPEPVVEEVVAEKLTGNIVGPGKKNEEIAFEPLHTTDYFASQGIKINDETLTNDKLGTQLKSFTEWLKSMKKLHSEKLVEGDENTDKAIRKIAENSNIHLNIVTEAMAEVLLNQGKTEQAIEIYNKLSLNYPSRNAYFAAKINSLKPV